VGAWDRRVKDDCESWYYSIATGIGLGFITYAACKILSGRYKAASPAVIVLALLFAVKFAMQ
jgi:AGZA family xanthine/uracil permease-like MFS transporter